MSSQITCFINGYRELVSPLDFFLNYYYFLMSSVPRSPQLELHRHGAGHFPTFSHVSHAWFPMGFSKLDFQKQLRSLFQWFLECLASHAWEKPGCQQQACNAFHKSGGHTDIILEFINVLKKLLRCSWALPGSSHKGFFELTARCFHGKAVSSMEPRAVN